MYEYEENSEIIGAHCTLLTPYKGYSEGTVVGDFGNKIVVRLSSGKEVVEYRVEVIIYDYIQERCSREPCNSSNGTYPN